MSAAAPTAAPLVTVLMPAYNAARHIDEAIRSVLAQTFTDFELVVVDDGSADDTLQRVQAYTDPRVVLVRQPRNGGEVAARNAGIEHARGTYIAMLDADDIAMPNRLETQLALLQGGADIVASRYVTWTPATGRRKAGRQYVRDADLKALLAVYCPLGHSTVIARADLFRTLRYDPEFARAPDYHLWTRMALGGARFGASEALLVTYRVHDQQISTSNLERVRAATAAVQAGYLAGLGIDAVHTPRKLPWRERLRVAPGLLAQLRARFGPVSLRANYEIYARFQFRGNGLLTPFVRLERFLVAAWARWLA